MDRDLVERAMAGDHDAFAELARVSIGRLFVVARLILRDEAAAEDATQEALVAAWRHIHGLRDADRFEAWLHRLLINACHREARRGGRRRTIEIHVETIEAPQPRLQPRRAGSGPARACVPPARHRPASRARPALLLGLFARRCRGGARRSAGDRPLKVPSGDAGDARRARLRRPQHCRGGRAGMTARTPQPEEFDLLLAAWLDADAQVREPDHLLADVLARTSRRARCPPGGSSKGGSPCSSHSAPSPGSGWCRFCRPCPDRRRAGRGRVVRWLAAPCAGPFGLAAKRSDRVHSTMASSLPRTPTALDGHLLPNSMASRRRRFRGMARSSSIERPRNHPGRRVRWRGRCRGRRRRRVARVGRSPQRAAAGTRCGRLTGGGSATPRSATATHSWLLQTARRPPTDIGYFYAGAWTPSWSPDNVRLAVASGNGVLWIANRDGSDARRLSRGDVQRSRREGMERGLEPRWQPAALWRRRASAG